MRAFAEEGSVSDMNMTAVLSVKDIQRESGAVEKPMNTEEVQNENETEMKSFVSRLVKQTPIIGTVEHPTIDGGLISAPQGVEALSEEVPEVVDETALLISVKLNEIFNRSAAYNSKVLLKIFEERGLNAWGNLRAKSRQVWMLWKKSIMEKSNKKGSLMRSQRVKHHGKH